MKKLLGKKTDDKQVKPKFVKPAAPPYTESWIAAGLTVVENDFGTLFKREVRYPSTYEHGLYKLSDLDDAINMWENADLNHPYALSSDETLIFFDTETTGLKGTGTHIFLLGLLEERGNEYVLTQYVLADPENEAAFLFESKFWQGEKTIISYNGKSFDWPMVETRWTLNQNIIPKLREQKQIDLLHSAKRLWKNDLEKMKLVQVEEEKLGFKRNGDIPGYLAPIIYFDAVKSGNAEALMKVLLHNEWDLLSLITLYIHQTKLLFSNNAESAVTYTNIGKWYGDLKQPMISEHVLTNVTENYCEQETCLAHFYLAFQQKRNGDFNAARTSFEKALQGISAKQKLQAYEQLAMLYEHQFRHYERALYYTEKGIENVRKSTLSVERKHTQLLRWEKRLHRIEKKRHES